MGVRAPAGRKETADIMKDHAKVYVPTGIAVMNKRLANEMVSRTLRAAKQAAKDATKNSTPQAKAAAKRLKDLDDMMKMKGEYKPRK